VNLHFKKKPTTFYFAASIHDTMSEHLSGVFPGWDVLAILPDEMRESLDASVAKSMHWIS